MSLLEKLVFRAPHPTTYTECTMPGVEFALTKSNHLIPVYFCNTWNHPSYLDPTGGGLWILFSHGNSEDLGNVAYWAEFLSDQLHIPILAYDYSGYGLSKHADPLRAAEEQVYPSEMNLYMDCEAALEFAETRYGLLKGNCIVWGRSLGSCASVHLATKLNVAGLIVQSGFVSVLAVGTSSIWGEAFNTYDMFRNYEKLRITPPQCPVFLIHGKLDKIVNWWHSQQLERVIPANKLWPSLMHDTCGHNDLELNCEDLLHEVYEFIVFCAFTRGYLDG